MMQRLLVIALLLAMACNPARTLTEQGNALRADGKYEEAANYYYNALLKKKGYAEAKDGLRIAAQKVLDEKFSAFSRFVVDNKVDDAMKQYKNAEKYAANAESVGVKLDWPYEYAEVYADIRDEYVMKLYDEAIMMVEKKQFDNAEKQLERIGELDSTFKGATVLRMNTVIEPLYQRGIRQLAKGEHKDAYNTFERVIGLDSRYRDVYVRRAEALDKANIKVGLLPSVSTGKLAGAGRWMDEALEREVTKSRETFVKITGADAVAKDLESKGWGTVTDKARAAEAGKNLGYRYVILVKIPSSDVQVTPFTKTQRQAYEAFTESILNPITGTYNSISKFRKAIYDDTYEDIRVRMSIAYELISCTDGTVVISDEFETEKKDEQHLLSYSGNINNLYEELPQGSFLPPPNLDWRVQFTMVKRRLRTADELASQICNEAAETIAYRLKGKLR